ncbi:MULTISPECIES: TetR/AcrR family transcriptional regulator [unclassified Streptomyces]|uniref:TetR/AcrR family transcriptional regulator n=1 Tax=unclassified Streptomyces TaxID=2593676 RepID=UPI000F71DF83|nr:MULTISPECIES: TetR/AcrR family transcriptional regulator [unclassified Streptomyces]AZM64203.1 TetR family transcriptional regulator [Streptomyces sp. WAC 01438]RSM93487.1 TetR family transcriptional regulator [Streptomyces sp. WAC 01420]
MSSNTVAAESLRDRRRRQTRDRIIEAAFALFVERGFDEVTVDEIARRAETGRTTFFRYFGDKQEVVFSPQSEVVRVLAQPRQDPAAEPLRDFGQALAASRRLVTELCTEIARRPDHYALYYQLVERHPELTDRHARKIRHYAGLLEEHLAALGAPRTTAVLAAETALGCYQAAWRLAGDDAGALVREVEQSFRTLLGMQPGAPPAGPAGR